MVSLVPSSFSTSSVTASLIYDSTTVSVSNTSSSGISSVSCPASSFVKYIGTGMKEQYLSITSFALYSLANSQLSSLRQRVTSVPIVDLSESLMSYSVPPSHSQCTALEPSLNERVSIVTLSATMNAEQKPRPKCPIIWSSLVLSLYFSRNASAPENAIWQIYSLTSSAVIPIPLSIILIVFLSELTFTSSLYSVSSAGSYSPIKSSFLSFVIASQPLEISSRQKMSWSEYIHFLIIGNIFWLLIDKLPCSFAISYYLPYKKIISRR